MKTEAELVEIVKEYFLKNNFKINTEIQMYSKRIDLVCIDKVTQEVYAIEVKLKNWKRAIQQALTYRLCADYSFVAIPGEIYQNIDMKFISQYGIGIITITQEGKVNIKKPALKSTIIDKNLKFEIFKVKKGSDINE